MKFMTTPMKKNITAGEEENLVKDYINKNWSYDSINESRHLQGLKGLEVTEMMEEYKTPTHDWGYQKLKHPWDGYPAGAWRIVDDQIGSEFVSVVFTKEKGIWEVISLGEEGW
jgi:hypothetical protein